MIEDTEFYKLLLAYSPLLLGVVQFLKAQLGWEGKKANWLAVGTFALCGVVLYMTVLFPEAAPHIVAVFSIVAVALGGPGFYKLVNQWTSNDLRG